MIFCNVSRTWWPGRLQVYRQEHCVCSSTCLHLLSLLGVSPKDLNLCPGAFSWKCHLECHGICYNLVCNAVSQLSCAWGVVNQQGWLAACSQSIQIEALLKWPNDLNCSFCDLCVHDLVCRYLWDWCPLSFSCGSMSISISDILGIPQSQYAAFPGHLVLNSTEGHT